MQGYLDLEQHL